MESVLPESDKQLSACGLSISVIGQFRLVCNKTELVLNARKDSALVAYLANAPAEPRRRSHLAALLWPQSEDGRARESLKQSLLRIRKVLPEGALDTDRHTATLMLEREQVDVSKIEDMIGIGTCEMILSAADRIQELFLSGLEDISAEYEDWRSLRQQEVLDLVKSAALSALQQSVSSGDVGQAVELAQCVAKLDPLDEESIRYLIGAYLADGRPRQAQRVFDELKNRLHGDLGIEPEPATVALIESLVCENSSNSKNVGSNIPRIAVLPFNVGVDESSQRYFAEGLTDDITTDLARNKSLEVLPASIFAGLQGDVLPVLLARGATHVLHGTVRRSQGRLRVNTRLSDTRNNQIVWAQRYDRTVEDVFDMQDAISSQIVMRLQLELKTDARGSEYGTRNASAYEMFHKGRSLYLRGINNHSLRAAKALLDRSIEIDPGFARAYAQLAICESYLAMSIVNKTGEDFSAQVLEHGRVALDMNPDLALGHAAVGLAFYASGKYEDAESALQNAITLDENLFEAQFFLARNRRLQGDHAGAVDRFRLAAALRPDDFRSSGLLGDSLKAIGFTEDANEVFRVAVERIEVELERYPDNAGALAFGAPILAELGRVEQAREWSAWSLAIEPDDCLSRYNQARLFAILDEPDESLTHLEAAFNAPLLVQRRLALWMRHDGDFECLEAIKRFNCLLEFATALE